MPLSTTELAYINNLLYSEHPSMFDQSNGNPQLSPNHRTLGDLFNKDSMDLAQNSKDFGFVSEKEWRMIQDKVTGNDRIANLRIEQSYYDPQTGDAGCVLVNPATKEAIICFRGTGSGEWPDNFQAGSYTNNPADRTISPQQQRALDFVNGLDLSEYSDVTVTGHSKGGNKAKLVTLLSDNHIDRCVSFDGQGFSDEFMQAHKADIIARQGKIENHNASADYVNILLNDVGRTEYHDSRDCGLNILKYHSPIALLDDNGNLLPGQQSPVTKAMNESLNRLMRTLPEGKRADVLGFLGQVADAWMGTDANMLVKLGRLRKVLSDPRYIDEIALLVACGYFDALSDAPVIGPILQKLREWGLLPERASGEDIRYDSPAPVDTDVTVRAGDLADGFIFVEMASISAAATELRRAVELYNSAIAELRAAAGDLATNWIGDGQRAFCANQERQFQLCHALGQIGFSAADVLLSTLRNYRDLVGRLSDMM